MNSNIYIDLNVIDNLQKSVSSDKMFIVKALTQYFDMTKDQIENIGALVEKKDFTTITSILHTLKGRSDLIGALHMAQTCVSLYEKIIQTNTINHEDIKLIRSSFFETRKKAETCHLL